MRRPGRYGCRSLWFVVVKWNFGDTINSLEQYSYTNELFGGEPPVPVSHPKAEVICVTIANGQ